MELDIQVGRNANASSFIQSIATHGHSSLTGPLLSLIIEEWTGKLGMVAYTCNPSRRIKV
jgi:hypothetical protein